MIFIFIRIITFFAIINVIFPAGTPNIFKVVFSLFMSTIIAFTVHVNVHITTVLQLINYSIVEIVTGLVLGFITSLCFNSLKIVGSLIDQQLGLSMINIYDPNSKNQSTLIENIMYWIGILVFFTMNGHHSLIEGIQHSFEIIPVGKSILIGNFNYVINVFIEYFAIGFKIAVPIVLCLIITEITMGLISRSVPQFNVMVIGMPIKLLVGIAVFIIGMPFILKEIHNLFNQLPSILDGTLKVKHGVLSSIGPVGMILSSSGDKTEEPTSKKKKDARKKGNVAKSKEVTTAITLIAILFIIGTMSNYMISDFKNNIIHYLSNDFKFNMDYNILHTLTVNLIISFMKLFLPIGLIIIVFSVIGNVMQTGFMFNFESIKLKFSKLNPINGFKNMFSMKSVGMLIKSVVVIAVLFEIGYSFMKKKFELIMNSGDIHLPYLIYTIVNIIKDLIINIVLAVVIIAVIDFAYQKYSYRKSLKMTKQEVKEEFKQVEGDPHIKGKIKQRQREMASKRMMQAVPSATVIVTNPTHISIAIRYERGKDTTPIVVAKGADAVAFKIREIAKEHDIPILENKPLARLIYKEVEIDQEIPEEMYQAVAEVLVAVYKIKNKYK